MIILPYKIHSQSIYVKKINSENLLTELLRLVISGIWFFIHIIPTIRSHIYFFNIKKQFNDNNSKPYEFVIIEIHYNKTPFYYISLKNYLLTIIIPNKKSLFVVKSDKNNRPIYAIGIRPKNSQTAILLNRKLSQLGGLSKAEKTLLIKKIDKLLPIAKSYV